MIVLSAPFPVPFFPSFFFLQIFLNIKFNSSTSEEENTVTIYESRSYQLHPIGFFTDALALLLALVVMRSAVRRSGSSSETAATTLRPVPVD